MDIFEGGPRGKFFEILSAASPALAQNKTAQAPIRSIACERKTRCFIAQNRALQDGLNDEFCR